MDSLQEEEGGEACFFSHGPDLVFWLVTLARLRQTRLLCIQKVRKINHNPRLWLARFITANRVKVLALIRLLLPNIRWIAFSCRNACAEIEGLVLCSHTVLIKPLSEGTSPRFKKGETCFLTFFFSLFSPFLLRVWGKSLIYASRSWRCLLA